ncbi:AlpA family phage regulatory protein [Methylibium rhizosphaerae]
MATDKFPLSVRIGPRAIGWYESLATSTTNAASAASSLMRPT